MMRGVREFSILRMAGAVRESMWCRVRGWWFVWARIRQCVCGECRLRKPMTQSKFDNQFWQKMMVAIQPTMKKTLEKHSEDP
jgi:hypothetical protein